LDKDGKEDGKEDGKHDGTHDDGEGKYINANDSNVAKQDRNKDATREGDAQPPGSSYTGNQVLNEKNKIGVDGPGSGHTRTGSGHTQNAKGVPIANTNLPLGDGPGHSPQGSQKLTGRKIIDKDGQMVIISSQELRREARKESAHQKKEAQQKGPQKQKE